MLHNHWDAITEMERKTMHAPNAIRLQKQPPNPEPKGALLAYLPIVRLEALRIHKRLPASVEIDDLYAAGVVGLLEAYSKFDPDKNVRFSDYAQFRVRGAILDCLRAGDWAPRMLRVKGRALKAAICTVTSRFMRAPADEELAAELNLSLSSYHQLLVDLHGLEIGTLHRTPCDDSGDEVLISIPSSDPNDPFSRCLEGEILERVTTAVENLPK